MESITTMLTFQLPTFRCLPVTYPLLKWLCILDNTLRLDMFTHYTDFFTG